MFRLRTISYIVAVIACLCIIGGLFWGCLESVAFDANYYTGEYQRLDREEATGMSAQGLAQATQTLLDYIRGGREDLNARAEIHGEQREVFNETEKAHMVDVRQLYRIGSTVCYMLWALGAACLVMLIIIERRQTVRMLGKGYLIALLAAGTAAGLAGSMIAMDFNRFWTGFHHVLFTNDLWLLDPTKDVLIQMFPSAFFSGMVESILLRFGAVLLVLGVAAAAVLIVPRRRKEAF